MTNSEILERVYECFEICTREYATWLDDCKAIDSFVEYNGIVTAARIDGAEGLLKLIKNRLNEES